MADPKIKFKRSAVAGKIPTAVQVPLGEIALNTNDGILYASKDVGAGTTVIAINPFRVGVGTNNYNAFFTAGNVGIGSTIPTSKLTVSGDTQISGVITATTFSGSGASLTNLNASNLASGTIPDARFPAALPAIDGSALTGITAEGLNAIGGLTIKNQSGNVAGTAGSVSTIDFNGSTGVTVTATTGAAGIATVVILAEVVSDTTPQLGGDLDLNGNNITGSGDIPAANLTGTLPAISGANLTNLNGSNISSGTVSAARVGALPASKITTGTFNAARIPTLNQDTTGTAALAEGLTGTPDVVVGIVTASSLDISGNVDVDGTLEADAITIDGVSLAETISDTVGAMVSSNTETGISVTYDDSDNTLDFIIGTLNQDTTGNAATATALETARNIGGVSFDGTANINLPGVNIAGNQNTSGTAALAEGLTGSPSISVTNITASGNVSIAGTLTYEDVTNIDSVGIVTARSGISIPDSQKIQLGDGNDLQIYHDGSNSYVKDAGTGALHLLSGNTAIKNAAENKTSAVFNVATSVDLYHNNSKKFETTSTGAKITGDLVVTGEVIPSTSAPGVTTTTSTSQTALDTFSHSTYTSAVYNVQATSGSNVHLTTINVIHDGSDTYLTEFATLKTGSSLATYTTDISGSDLRLLATPASTNATIFSVSRTLIRTSDSDTVTTTSTSATTINQFATTNSSAIYVVQAKQGSNVHTTKIHLVHDGSTVSMTEFAIVKTGSSLASYDADISGSNVRLRATSASSSSTTYTISRNLL